MLQIIPIYAEPPQDDPESELYPSITAMFGGKNTSTYLTTYRPNYYFDLKGFSIFKGTDDFDKRILNIIANLLFYVQKGIAYIVIVIVYFSFEIDFINASSPENPFGLGFGSILEKITKNLKVTIFDELMAVMILLLGLFYVAKMVKDQKTQVWVAIIQTVVIIALAVGFFQQPATMLNAIDGVSKGLSESILSGTYKATNKEATAASAATMACNDIWVMFVHKPWQILEFGSVAKAEQYEDSLLRLPPDSEERKDLISSICESNKNLFTPIWGLKRLSAIILSIIPVLAMAAIIALICLLKLGYSFLMILVAVFGVLVFVMALVPWWGFRALQGWASKLVAYGCTGILISFVIALIFTFMTMLYDLSDKLGWFLVVILQLLIIIMVFWKREKIFDFITTFRTAAQHGPNAINKQMRRDANLEGKLSNSVRASRERRQHEETYTRSMRKEKYEVPDSETEDDSSIGRTPPKSNRILYNLGIGDKPETEYYSDEKSVDNLVNMMETAKSILEKRFKAEKKQEDYISAAEGRTPRYSDFVKNAMSKDDIESKFDNKDILAVIDEMKQAHKAGLNLEDLYPEEPEMPDKKAVKKKMIEEEEKKAQQEEYEWFISRLNGVGKDDIPLAGEKQAKTNTAEDLLKPVDKGEENTAQKKKVQPENSKNGIEAEPVKKDAQTSQKSVKDDLYYDDNRSKPSNEVSKDYKSLLKLAEEILEKQYENEKQEAERKAERTGKQPEYSYFVQAAMGKEKMNLPKFDERQKLAIANDLKRIYATGGSTDGMRTSTNRIEMKRPKSVIEFAARNDRYEAPSPAVNVKSLADISKELTREFNADYDKQYDHKFMEKLIAQYGDSNVRKVLDKMKELQLKDNRITNPAGYITDALKNNLRDKVKMGGDK